MNDTFNRSKEIKRQSKETEKDTKTPNKGNKQRKYRKMEIQMNRNSWDKNRQIQKGQAGRHEVTIVT